MKAAEKKKEVPAVKWVVREALKVSWALFVGVLFRGEVCCLECDVNNATPSDSIFSRTVQLKSDDADLVASLFSSRDAVSALAERVHSLPPASTIRSSLAPADLDNLREDVGSLVRDLGQTKGLRDKWELAVLIVALEDVVARAGRSESVDDESAVPVLELYGKLLEICDELDLRKVWELKPLLSGDDIVRILNRKPGPGMKEILVSVVVWQMRNPTGSTSECEEWLRSRWT
ncbi:hypothetical protein M427DRAFT_55162 [Gonapodya prolifera JEL478]|uniref:Uncharacterized protein n=1 Tax=Gonapodya prolifera (strain JEL478) TaxID=1344416 RepID=A0A139AJE2_GONPJ|nr:hypothetical protein M427DRAFT_55162 [Gonapodya prolifera JEL478]|eukprot:KXS16818.1 hypothetical protein M427DRAFT_55162 [Gonapodya prolifera JEL478]